MNYVMFGQVGAPPEVAARLAAAQQEFEARQRASLLTCRDPSKDPELDQFMVINLNKSLINYSTLLRIKKKHTRDTDFDTHIKLNLSLRGDSISKR